MPDRMESNPEISWTSVATFVRQHTHDVRNHLNSLDLEAALLAELVTDEEGRSSVTRLRRQIREAANSLRALSGKFSDPKPNAMPMSARDIFEIWQEQHAAMENAPAVNWTDELGSEKVSLDPDAITASCRELLENAKAFKSAGLQASAKVDGSEVVYELREKKEAPVDPGCWGRAPFGSTRRGGYGLGLWEMDRRVRASGGEVERSFDSKTSELVTTLRFPVHS